MSVYLLHFPGWLFDRFGNYTASFLSLGFVPLISMTPMIICDIIDYMKYHRYSGHDCFVRTP